MNPALLIVCTAIISGVSIFVNKWAVAGFDTSAYTFLKNVVVAMFLVGIIGFSRDRLELKGLKRRDWSLLVLIGLIGGSIPFVLFFEGLRITSAASASFIHKTMFVPVIILAAIFLRERITKGLLISGALLLGGNIFLLAPTWSGFDIGMAMVLSATLLWAIENTVSKYALKTVNPRLLASARMVFGSLFLLAYLGASGKWTSLWPMTGVQVAWLALTAALLLGYVLTWYTGLKSIPLSQATCILMLGSVLTSVLQMASSGQLIELPKIAGLILLFAGSVGALWLTANKGLDSWRSST